MCLGVPGKILSLHEGPAGMTMGKISFGGIIKEICLAYVPGVAVDDYVIVHAGFAISQIDEQEAQEVFEYLRQIGELEELELAAREEELNTP
jgi:hydrogenase expression/formation protein HypC